MVGSGMHERVFLLLLQQLRLRWQARAEVAQRGRDGGSIVLLGPHCSGQVSWVRVKILVMLSARCPAVRAIIGYDHLLEDRPRGRRKTTVADWAGAVRARVRGRKAGRGSGVEIAVDEMAGDEMARALAATMRSLKVTRS